MNKTSANQQHYLRLRAEVYVLKCLTSCWCVSPPNKLSCLKLTTLLCLKCNRVQNVPHTEQKSGYQVTENNAANENLHTEEFQICIWPCIETEFVFWGLHLNVSLMIIQCTVGRCDSKKNKSISHFLWLKWSATPMCGLFLFIFSFLKQPYSGPDLDDYPSSILSG